jgi:hypothetical protein
MFRAVTRSQGWRDMLRFAGMPFATGTAALEDEEEIAALALTDRDATLRWLEALAHGTARDPAVGFRSGSGAAGGVSGTAVG